MDPMKISLADLVRPLTAEAFVETHLLTGQYHLSAPNPDLVRRFLDIEELAHLPSLLARLDRVWLFGPDGFRVDVEASRALKFYARGNALYMDGVGDAIPALGRMLSRVCANLGLHPRWVDVEAFAAKGGAISSMHYDHESNFQILLRGEKQWRIANNRTLRHPVHSHHDLGHPVEEALATSLPFPAEVFDTDDVRAEAGSVLFFPMGTWHEVESVTDSFAINVVVKPPRLYDAIARVLASTLVADPEMRAATMGLVGAEVCSPLARHGVRLQALARRKAMEALAELPTDRMGLVFDDTCVRWAEEATNRTIIQRASKTVLLCPDIEPEGFEVDTELEPVIHAILPFHGSFTFEQLARMAPTPPAEPLMLCLLVLRARGYLTNDVFEDCHMGGRR